jgi:hypothetical protein
MTILERMKIIQDPSDWSRQYDYKKLAQIGGYRYSPGTIPKEVEGEWTLPNGLRLKIIKATGSYSAHRVFVLCDCNKWVTAGRIRQHYASTEHSGERAARMSDQRKAEIAAQLRAGAERKHLLQSRIAVAKAMIIADGLYPEVFGNASSGYRLASEGYPELEYDESVRKDPNFRLVNVATIGGVEHAIYKRGDRKYAIPLVSEMERMLKGQERPTLKIAKGKAVVDALYMEVETLVDAVQEALVRLLASGERGAKETLVSRTVQLTEELKLSKKTKETQRLFEVSRKEMAETLRKMRTADKATADKLRKHYEAMLAKLHDLAAKIKKAKFRTTGIHVQLQLLVGRAVRASAVFQALALSVDFDAIKELVLTAALADYPNDAVEARAVWKAWRSLVAAGARGRIHAPPHVNTSECLTLGPYQTSWTTSGVCTDDVDTKAVGRSLIADPKSGKLLPLVVYEPSLGILIANVGAWR